MTSLKVSSPAELISAVPFLIGFHPADSLTVVALRGPRVTFAVRMDLPEHDVPEEEARAAVHHLAAVVLQQQTEAVTILGYGDEPRVTPALLRVSHAFRRAGVTVVDELRVADGRFWSYLCTDPACCPAEGRPCEPADSRVATEATFAGAVALPSREALAARLAPAVGDDREAMLAATARAVLRLAALAGDLSPGARAPERGPRPGRDSSSSCVGPGLPPGPTSGLPHGRAGVAPRRFLPGAHLGKLLWAELGLGTPGAKNQPLVPDEDRFFAQVRRAGREAVREAERCYRSGGRLTDDQAAWLGVLLLNTPVRDYAWTRTGVHEWEITLWSDLARRVEARYVPAPAALLAFVAWRSGQGPLASVAVERALTEKPDYSLAVLMHETILTGLPPETLHDWPAVNGLPPFDTGAEKEAVGISARARRSTSPDTARDDEAHHEDVVHQAPTDRPARQRPGTRRAAHRRL